MWRWLRELLHPAEKCTRLGHWPLERVWIGWLSDPTEPCPVRVRRVRPECGRCGALLRVRDWRIVRRTTYAEVSWPQEDWDELEAQGELCRETYVQPLTLSPPHDSRELTPAQRRAVAEFQGGWAGALNLEPETAIAYLRHCHWNVRDALNLYWREHVLPADQV